MNRNRISVHVVLCLLWTGLTCDPALCVDNEELTAARFGVELVQILDAADVKLWIVPRGNVSKKTAPVEKEITAITKMWLP